MGGTLPAAARAVETSDDRNRRNLALLYGANTLGAVTGTLLATFYMLEHFGTRNTLLCAAALNAVVGIVAIKNLILISSAVVGFAFLLMELVWYRMLTPLLGIGLGSAAPGAGAFAITCTLEALAVIFPFALGDRLVLLANLLRTLGVQFPATRSTFPCFSQFSRSPVSSRMEPDFPWMSELLRLRKQCYESAHLGELAERAGREWQEFQANEPETLTH